MSLRLVHRAIWANPGNRGARIRKTVAAIRWQLLKRTVRRSELLRLRSGALFMAHPDCVVSSSLVYADWPEYREIEFIRSRIPPGSATVDVGACVGHISLLLSDLVDPLLVFAFEPTPLSYARLVENWRLNRWPTDHLYRTAVGAESASVFVADTPTPATTNRVQPRRGDATVEVPQIALDELSALRGLDVGLFKIDVEGAELEVFRGARRFLREVRPRVVMFESLGGDLDRDIRSILESAGYRVFGLDDRSRPDAERLDSQNLFALPETAR